MDTLGKFSTSVYKEISFVTSCLYFPAHQVPSEKGSTLKERNLLPWGANS